MAYIFVLLAALLWGSTAAVGKLLLNGLGNFQLLFLSNLIAFFGLLTIVFFQGKLNQIKKLNKSDITSLAALGFLGVFLYYFFIFGALERLPAQEAFIINYLWPIMVIVFAVIILKEKITPLKITGLILSFIGVVIVATKGNLTNFSFDNPLGIFLAIAAAVSYGLFSVLGKKQKHDQFISTMFYYFFASIYSFVAIILFSSFPQTPSLPQLAGLIWLGVFTNGLAFVFWFMALKLGDITKISNIIFITPFISLIYIYFLLGEKILPSSIIGLVVIVTGILIQSAQGKLSKK